MDMQGSRALAVTQQQAWQALNDPQVLKACIPGCDSIEAAGENRYALVNAIKIGPVAAKFKGSLQLADIDAPRGATIEFDGNGGAAGFGKGSAKVTLTPNDAGCELAYTVHASVGGKIAQVGQRLIDGVAKSMAESFFKRFDEEMRLRHPSATDLEAAGADAATAARPGAAKPVPVWLWVAGIAALAVGYWVLRNFG
jgi:carbon monoxide dehydrogenase subunit G